MLVTTPHDLENITLELLQNQKKIIHIFERGKQWLKDKNKLSEHYLTQSITIDLLRDPFVEKETPVVDTKVLAIGTKQIKQSRSETSYMQS